MIKTRCPGEWTCTTCDARHNGYIATQIWWRGVAPKVCWTCLKKQWSEPAKVSSAAMAIAGALEKVGKEFKNSIEVKDYLHDVGFVVKGASKPRFAAMVFRALQGSVPKHIYFEMAE